MSKNSWHGGKGDGSRVSNHKSYRNCPLWNKKDKVLNVEDVGYIDPVDVETQELYMGRKKRKCLFLDDIRVPQNAYLWDEKKSLYDGSGVKSSHWAIVRSYDQFVDYVERNGIPDVISFDNDLFELGHPDVSVEDLTKQLLMKDWEMFPIKTGAHCAQYLANKCISLNQAIPEYYVHSANNNARPIIRNILNNAIHGKI